MRKILILMLILVFVFGCAKKPAVEPVPEEVAFPEEAVISPIVEVSCEGLEGEARQGCLDFNAIEKAKAGDDESACEGISNEVMKQECIDSIITLKALDEGDISLCSKVSNPDNCIAGYYVSKAMAENNAAACDKIEDEATREDCKGSFQINTDFSNLEEGNCDGIVDEELKAQCKFNEITSEVAAKDDVSLCEQLSEGAKSNCINNYYFSKAVAKDDISLCNNVDDADSCKDSFYSVKAIEDETFCDKIKAEELKKICKGEVI